MTPDAIVQLSHLGATERAAIRNLTTALCDRGWNQLVPDAVLAVTGFLVRRPDGAQARALAGRVPSNFMVRNKTTRDQFAQVLVMMSRTKSHL